MVVPPTMLIVGVIGGLGTAASYGAYRYAEKIGPKLTPSDFLPAPPPHPPVPRFLFNPEIIAELRRK